LENPPKKENPNCRTAGRSKKELRIRRSEKERKSGEWRVEIRRAEKERKKERRKERVENGDCGCKQESLLYFPSHGLTILGFPG
jgi:hypothetical protein